MEYIRLIRSNRQLRVLDHTFTMPEAVVYEYVTATLVVEDRELVVTTTTTRAPATPSP